MITKTENVKNTSHSAPALSRGLEIIRILGRSDGMSLEDINKACGYPKSTIFRLMGVLEDENIVLRSDDKVYRLAQRLVPVGGGTSDFQSRIPLALKFIAENSKQTAEWYTSDNGKMYLSDRAEPEGEIVRVVARIGFTRGDDNELDSVSLLGRAFFDCPKPNGRYWIYGKGANQEYIKNSYAVELIDTARRNSWAVDNDWNSNGVRRCAAAIVIGGDPAGIFSIAESMSPISSKPDKYIKLLQEASNIVTG